VLELARIDVFLNDQVGVVALNHILDLEPLMARENGEPPGRQSQTCVVLGLDSHDAHAARVDALADEVVRPVPLIAKFHDALVDVAETNSRFPRGAPPGSSHPANEVEDQYNEQDDDEDSD
jgi:hypothetical protein